VRVPTARPKPAVSLEDASKQDADDADVTWRIARRRNISEPVEEDSEAEAEKSETRKSIPPRRTPAVREVKAMAPSQAETPPVAADADATAAARSSRQFRSPSDERQRSSAFEGALCRTRRGSTAAAAHHAKINPGSEEGGRRRRRRRRGRIAGPTAVGATAMEFGSACVCAQRNPRRYLWSLPTCLPTQWSLPTSRSPASSWNRNQNQRHTQAPASTERLARTPQRIRNATRNAQGLWQRRSSSAIERRI